MTAVLKLGDVPDLLLPEDNTGYITKLLLSTILQHLSLTNQKIEFKGKDAHVIQGLAKKHSSDTGKSLHYQSGSHITQKQSSESVKSSLKGESVITGDDKEERIIVENGQVKVAIPAKIVSANAFSRLENKVKSQQAQIEAMSSNLLPTEDDILEEVRSKPETKPVQSLLQSLNIAGRMSASEMGMEKLGALLETVATEYATVRDTIDKLNAEFGANQREAMEIIKTAADYAKRIKPREDLLRRYKSTKVDEETATSQLGDLGSVVGQNIDLVQSAFSPKLSQKGPFLVTESNMESMKSTTPSGFVEANYTDSSNRSLKDSSSKRVQSQRTDTIAEPSSAIAQAEASLRRQEAAIQETSSLWTVIPMLKPNDKLDPERANKLLAQHEYLRKNMEFMNAQINTLAEFADYILPEIIAGMPHATELRKRIAELQKDTKPACPDGPDDNDEVLVTSKDLNERMEGAEVRLIKHQAKLRRQDMIIAEKTMDLDNRIGKLTKSLADVVEVLGLRKHKHKPKEEEEMDQIFGKIGNVEEALIEIGCATQKLLDDKEYKMTLLENLSEEIKLIKTLKLDRFEVEDILASKADCDELNKKVPLDRFDEITNELARGIDDALAKVSAQQSLVASTLLEMQNSLDTKFDKSEVEALKEDFNKQVQVLKDELAKLAAMKEGRVAAGGKKKFITDINCLSCDRNAAMATQNNVPCIPALADLTHMRSIRPFITYELEYLRKMKIKDPEIIKYIEYEELFRRYKLKANDSYDNLANVPNLKNRYCGGAHTVTGPQQKVPHTGHFNMANGGKNV